MSAHVFVTDFPADEARAISTAMLNGKFSLSLVRDAWVVVEYGLNEILPAAKMGMATGPDPEISETTALQELLAASNVGDAFTAIPLPWTTILLIILKAIIALLTTA